MSEPINISHIELKRIKPSPTNPRKHFDQAKLEELAFSIRDKGLLSPLTVRMPARAPGTEQQYEIIAGERRWRAAQLAGLEVVPVIIRELSDRQVLEVQMIENLQRDDLSPLEEAQGYELMLKLEEEGRPVYTQESLARAIGKSERYVYKRRQLARLKGEALTALEKGLISVSLALALCRVQNEEKLKLAAKDVLHS
jgi:ParB family chromosome partitioning protein